MIWQSGVARIIVFRQGNFIYSRGPHSAAMERLMESTGSGAWAEKQKFGGRGLDLRLCRGLSLNAHYLTLFHYDFPTLDLNLTSTLAR